MIKVEINLLQNAKIENVVNEPITFLHCRNVLPNDLYQELAETYPEEDTLQGRTVEEAGIPRYILPNLKRESLTDTWNKFIDHHTSQDFYGSIFSLLSYGIQKYYPDHHRRLSILRTSLRGIDFNKKTAMMDFQFVLNGTKQVGNTSRTPHLDNYKQLWVLMWYMKKENDDSDGGDFIIYKPKGETVNFFGKREANIDQIEPMYTVPYEANSFILILNHRNSIHGVTPRTNPKVVRRYLNMTCHTPVKLFDFNSES